jgi:competence protein ComEC
VFFGAGIAGYFALSFEPDLRVGILSVAVLLPASVVLYRRHHDSLKWFFCYIGAVAALFAACGFLAAEVGTRLHGTPVLEKSIGPVDVSGAVESVDDLGGKDGSRVILTDLTIEKLAPEKTPRKIRLRFKKNEGLKAGVRISTLAKIEPPSGAVMPGAYDFRRHLFFEGIGGVGFSYRAAEILEADTDAPVFFEKLRTHINERIKARAGDVTSGIMTALITGERAAIDDADDNAMRDSGLYHLLSISGTHVTMVAGVLFFMSRFLMACFPWVALHWPIKKIAAVVALCGAAFYVFLAGAEVPAQRALLMTALIMVAIMLDRSPFSLRLIAFAALAVLVVAPFALIGVSFQMSFAAVAALICFFEWIGPWWIMWYGRSGFVRKAFMYLIGIFLTSVIAGAVTGLYCLYHFQSFAVYGVLSNMMAVPLTGVVIMPAAILSLFLMPFGVEGFALQVMEWGAMWMLAIAHWAAGLDGAVLHVRQWSGVTFAFLCVGTVLFLLWEGWRGKAVAGALIAAGLVVTCFTPFPDVVVSGTGKLVAVRAGEDLFLSSGRREKFVAENWMRLAGMEGRRAESFYADGSPVLCDADACRMERDGRKVSLVKTNKGFYEDCRWADVVIAEIPEPKEACRDGAVVLDLYDFKDNAAHAIYLEDLRVRSVGGEGGDRPWTM